MDQFFDLLGKVADFAGAVGGIISAVGVLKLLARQGQEKQDVRVLLTIQGEGRSVELPLVLKRRDVSRAELLGRIGMLPMRQKGARFSLRALSTAAFMAAVNEVVDGKSTTLVIPASREEVEQFDLPAGGTAA